MSTLSGHCNCGAIEFVVTGSIRKTTACYCRMCRAQGGVFYSAVIDGEISVKDDTTLTWFSANGKAERGFCNRCGASLFWKPIGDNAAWDVNLSALNDCPTETVGRHIFTAHTAPFIPVPNDAPHDPRENG